MATRKQLFGKAPLTLVRTRSGQVSYVYKGRPAPDDVDPDERKRLLKDEYLVEREVDVEAASEDAAEDGDKPTTGRRRS